MNSFKLSISPPIKTAFKKPMELAADALFFAADGLSDLARILHYQRVANIEFKHRPDDIFIVTYPRSGTTWLQMIMYQLISDGKMEIDHIAQKVPWFERLIHYRIWGPEEFETMPSPRIFKCHLPVNEMPKGTGKCIYVARNGFDVAVSYFEFYRSHLDFKGNFDQFLKRFIKGDVQFGSWFSHVSSWKRVVEKGNSAQTGAPPQVLFLTFEDLKNDFESQLDKIISFTGFDIPNSRRPGIIERCGFDFMKDHEEKFDHITAQIWEKNYRRAAFIRKGNSGSGHIQFSNTQKEAFQRTLKQFHIETLCP